MFSHAAGENIHHIGVLSFRGISSTLERWDETAETLTKSIPGHHFVIHPMTHARLEQALQAGTIDFVLTNPGHYFEISRQSRLVPLATLVNKRNGEMTTEFGSVLFVRADNQQVQRIEDIRGRSLIAVSPSGFGGFQVGQKVLLEHGIDPYHDLSELMFSGFPVKKVLTTVMEGTADVGLFRSDLLEGMASKGWLKMEDVRVLNLQQYGDYPFLLSTPLYPEWFFAARDGVPEALQEQVFKRLQQVTEESAAAVKGMYVGWSAPADLRSVERLYLDLGLMPDGPSVKRSQVALIVIFVFIAVLLLLFYRRWQLSRLLQRNFAITFLLILLLSMFLYYHSQYMRQKEEFDLTNASHAVEEVTDRLSAHVKTDRSKIELIVDEIFLQAADRVGDSAVIERLYQSASEKIAHQFQNWRSVAIVDRSGRVVWSKSHRNASNAPLPEHFSQLRAADRYTGRDPIYRVSPIYRAGTGRSFHYDLVVPVEIGGEQLSIVLALDAKPFLTVLMRQSQLADVYLIVTQKGTGEVEFSNLGMKIDPRQYNADLERIQQGNFSGVLQSNIPTVEWVVSALMDSKKQSDQQIVFWTPFLTAYGLLFILSVTYLRRVRKDEQLLLDANENLRRSELLLNETEHIGHIGSWELDLVSNDLTWSDEVFRIFEIDKTRFDASYEGFLNVIHPDDRDLVNLAYSESVEKRTPYEIKHRLLMTDGSIKWVLERGVTEYSEQGVPMLSRGMVQDVTEQVESSSQLQQAMVSKDEFLASMSHELRTPLTSILGYCDMMLDEQTDTQQIRYLNAIRSSGEGQLALVNDILDMSKIESGRFTVEQIPFSLQSLIEQVRSTVSVKAQDAGIELKITQAEYESFKLLGDGQRIKQVLLNLLGNSIKFTERGSVTLSVYRNGEKLQFDVIDTGVGIHPENMDKLFQRFEQEDGSISRRYGGSGLGLFISQSLAELMGGELTAVSELGQGSTFALRIPYQVTDEEDQAQENPYAEPVTTEQIKGTVLLAEDTPLIQQLIKRMLIKLGLEVEIAENGEVAVGKVMSRPFDLVLMDMQMPILDGIGATKKIRKVGLNVPVIALTANVMQKHREQFKVAGCDDFLGKPIDKEMLLILLRKFLKQEEEEHAKIDLKTIHWQPQYSVGCPAMDHHHQTIVGLINQLIKNYINIDLDESRQRIKEILIQLNQYANTHLQAEEELLESVDYEELQAHRQLHEQYRRLVSSYYERELSKKHIGQLISLLREWWMNHILKEDMAYKQVVEARTEKLGRRLIPEPSEAHPAEEVVDEELMKFFRESAANDRQQLEEALDRSDWKRIKEVAHPIKGYGSSFGYPVLTARAKDVCDACDKDQLDHLPQLTQILLDELSLVIG